MRGPDQSGRHCTDLFGRSTVASVRRLGRDASWLHETGFRLLRLHGCRRRAEPRAVPLILPRILQRIAFMNDRSGNVGSVFGGLSSDLCRRRKQGDQENSRDREMISHIGKASCFGAASRNGVQSTHRFGWIRLPRAGHDLESIIDAGTDRVQVVRTDAAVEIFKLR